MKYWIGHSEKEKAIAHIIQTLILKHKLTPSAKKD